MICFHFCIFALLETAGFQELAEIQQFIEPDRIKKQDVSKHKIPLHLRDFMFKTVQAADQEY